MVALIDTNVLIDYLAERGEFFEPAKKVLELCAQDKVDGYIAFHSLPNIWFILRKRPDAERREMLEELCKVLTVVGASHQAVLDAIRMQNFKDFEDCLQDKCACTVFADYIITRNGKDFQQATTKIVTPQEFCQIVNE